MCSMRMVGSCGWFLALSAMFVTIISSAEAGAAEPRELKVGAVLPLTGEAAKYGEAARKAIELAVDELNTGKTMGGKLSVVFEDSQGTPKGAVSALQKLIATERTPVVIGDLLSSNVLAMAPVANQNKVVILSPTASAPKITKAGDYIFRNCASDVFEGAIIAKYVRDLRVKRVAILYINNDYGVGIRDVFKKNLSIGKPSVSVVAEESFAQAATDFRSQLAKVKAKNPQVTMIVGYRELGQLLKQAVESGLKSQYVSTVMFEDPEILKVAGTAAEGVIYSARAYDPTKQDKQIQTFVAAFHKRYNDTPDIFAGLSYDAAKIIALAIRRGGYTANGIKKALYGIKKYPGVAGETTFDANGDVIQPATLKVVKSGEFVYLRK